jgi:hypothetical protein
MKVPANFPVKQLFYEQHSSEHVFVLDEGQNFQALVEDFNKQSEVSIEQFLSRNAVLIIDMDVVDIVWK